MSTKNIDDETKVSFVQTENFCFSISKTVPSSRRLSIRRERSAR